MQYKSLISEQELRQYIFDLVEETESKRNPENESEKLLSYFKLQVTLNEIVVLTVHESAFNKKLKLIGPDAGNIPYHSLHIPTQELRKFKTNWKEAEVEEGISVPGMSTYYIRSFYILNNRLLQDVHKRA